MSFFINKPDEKVYVDIFTATEGQEVFTLTEAYDISKNKIEVLVGQVAQFSPSNFTKTSSSSITLSVGVSAGTEVVVRYS